MEYDTSKGEFEVLIRLFTDDFEAILNSELDTDIKVTGSDLTKNYKYIDRFIKLNFEIWLNNRNIFEKAEIYQTNQDVESNTTEVLYRFKHKIPKKVKIRNSIFLSKFSDQKNLFIFTCGKTQESFKFNKRRRIFEFKM
jgi:hypothetical protein